jgi:uncharacterized membrane protein YcjF (UPF0283 family)
VKLSEVFLEALRASFRVTVIMLCVFGILIGMSIFLFGQVLVDNGYQIVQTSILRVVGLFMVIGAGYSMYRVK